MSWFTLLLQYLLGLFRRPVFAPAREARRTGSGYIARAYSGWPASVARGWFCLRPLQNVELGSHVFARRLPERVPAQLLRAERRRNRRAVYEPSRRGGAS